MLLLKLSNACFLDSPENVNIHQRTCQFVLQYILNCASQRELDLILVSNKGQLREKDIDKLPKSVQKEIREAVKKRRTI